MFSFLHFFSPYSIPKPQFFFGLHSQEQSDVMINLDSFQGLPKCEIKQNQNH